MDEEGSYEFLEAEFHLFEKAKEEKMPFCFYYNVKSERIEPIEIMRSPGDYTYYATLSMWQNSEDFIRLLKNKRGNDLLEEFEAQFFLYKRGIEDLPAIKKKRTIKMDQLFK